MSVLMCYTDFPRLNLNVFLNAVLFQHTFSDLIYSPWSNLVKIGLVVQQLPTAMHGTLREDDNFAVGVTQKRYNELYIYIELVQWIYSCVP